MDTIEKTYHPLTKVMCKYADLITADLPRTVEAGLRTDSMSARILGTIEWCNDQWANEYYRECFTKAIDESVTQKVDQPLQQFILKYLAMDRFTDSPREDVISSFVEHGKKLLQPKNEHYIQATCFVGAIVQMESCLLNIAGQENEQLIALEKISRHLKSTKTISHPLAVLGSGHLA